MILVFVAQGENSVHKSSETGAVSTAIAFPQIKAHGNKPVFRTHSEKSGQMRNQIEVQNLYKWRSFFAYDEYCKKTPIKNLWNKKVNVHL